MSFAIHGLGTALPEGRLSQSEALACARALGGPNVREAQWLPAVYAHSEIDWRFQVIGREVVDDLVNETRYSNSPFLPGNDGGPGTGDRMRIYSQTAPPLAIRAAAEALNQSGWAANSLTHLVTVSCTGFAAPGVDLALVNELRLKPSIERVHVGFMGCHGALNGLRVANAFAGANSSARVLMVAVELCSLHYYYGNEPDKVVANALFADGAAAVVGSADASNWAVASTGSCYLPDSASAMSWSVGDRGFEMTLSRHIPKLIARHLKPWLVEWLGDNGLSLGDVGSWAVHPGGPKILGAVEEGLGLPPAALAPSRAVFAACGNMSSPTVLFILEKLREADASRPCVMLGFGPGLVAEAALLK